MSEKKLNNLKKLLSAMDENSITYDEMINAFKKLLDILTERIEKTERQLIDKIDAKLIYEKEDLKEIKDKFDSIIHKAQIASDSTFSGIKNRMFEIIASFFAKSQIKEKLDNKLKEIDEKLSQIKDGEVGTAGKDADINETALLASQMALKSLENKEIDIGVVRGLKKRLKRIKEQLEELKKREPKIIYQGGGGGGGEGGHIVKGYDLSASLDGSTKTFTLPAFWRIISVQLSVDTLRETTDYTFDASAMTITFTSEIDAATSLASGQTCVIVYSEP